eukprot:196985_1
MKSIIQVVQPQNVVNNFDKLAFDTINNFGGITNLQLAPNAILSDIYPLEGHEKAIGHDLLADPNRREAVIQAIESETITFAGPLVLIQGGVSVIARNPVFVNATTDHINATEKFYSENGLQ